MSNPYNNPRNLAKAQSKANKYSKKITLKPSTRKNKKLDAFVKKNGKNVKVASFGDSRYTDFILSGDKKKRKAYRTRHAKDLLVNPKNKFTPGKLSYFILW